MNDTSHLAPPPWNHQWMLASRLRSAIEDCLGDLPEGKGELVVDLGCGRRPYETLLRNRGYGYLGCDLDDEADLRLVPSRPIDLPTGRAGGIVSFQVLEHVWDIDWYLGEARRVLSPDGWLMLSTHGVWPYHPHPTDYRRWTRDGLVKELEVRGFRVERVRAILGPLAWTTQVRLLGWYHLLKGAPWLLAPIAAVMNLKMLFEEAITPDTIRSSNGCVYLTLSRLSTVT